MVSFKAILSFLSDPPFYYFPYYFNNAPIGIYLLEADFSSTNTLPFEPMVPADVSLFNDALSGTVIC